MASLMLRFCTMIKYSFMLKYYSFYFQSSVKTIIVTACYVDHVSFE